MRAIWINLKSSLWFVPALCVLFAAGFAVGLVEFDAGPGSRLVHFSPQFFGISPEGARSLLSSIAQSVITIAGVSFSITIVTLSIAANQYSPRVLRNFMRDRGNQAVLGGLVGIFTYCILVLRTIQGGSESFVPTYSVVLALVLAVLAIGLFIYFVHHIATAIQASTIISSVALETCQTIHALYPKEAAMEGEESQDSNLTEVTPLLEGSWQPVYAQTSGYLQSVEIDGLIELADRHDTVLRLECMVGGFIIQGSTLLRILCKTPLPPETMEKFMPLFNIQSFRTIDQDPEFGLRQIVDIAVKALSPGINDPTTAVTCLDYLSSILSVIIERRMPSRRMYAHGKMRLIIQRASFESLLDLAFNEIRHHANQQPPVLHRILVVLESLGTNFKVTSERRRLLAKHADLVLLTAEQYISFTPQLTIIRAHAEHLLSRLSKTPA